MKYGTILFGKAVRKFANAVNGFTGFFRATPPALILPLADVKIGVQGSPHRKKPVNPSPHLRIFSPLFRKEWYINHCNVILLDTKMTKYFIKYKLAEEEKHKPLYCLCSLPYPPKYRYIPCASFDSVPPIVNNVTRDSQRYS